MEIAKRTARLKKSQLILNQQEKIAAALRVAAVGEIV